MKNKILKIPVPYTTPQGEEKTKWIDVGKMRADKNGKPYLLMEPHINFAAFDRGGNARVPVQIFDEEETQGQRKSFDGRGRGDFE